MPILGSGNGISALLPEFPWDTLAAAKIQAQAHPDGLVDLSVGTPVDPVDSVIRKALASQADFSGYPTTIGTVELREAAVGALARRYQVNGLTAQHILPVIGTKEAIASLPSQLGICPGDTVVIPEIAYPTYEVGALLAGVTPVRADSTVQLGPGSVDLIYLNSPSNPTGKVLPVEHLRKMVAWARERGAVIVSDECYVGLGWEESPVSILDERVTDGDITGLLAVHSLSKTSNLASYRAGFIAGDPQLIAELLTVRKHSGLIVPFPVQVAMTMALTLDEHEIAQKQRYRERRATLLAAVTAAGFTVDESAAGLYLWATRGENCRTTVEWLAARGILVAPGDFYGPQGVNHVRIALTATDERIAAAVKRLTS